MLLQSVAEVDAALSRALRDAARDSERILGSLPEGVGGQVTESQILRVFEALRELAHTLWGDAIPGEVARMIARAEERSRQGADILDWIILGTKSRDRGIQEAIRRAQDQRARRVAEVLRTREESAKFELSQRVYKWEAWHNGVVERRVAAGFARGASAREIARDVRQFIDPNTPGGASYAAKRLGRTEVANAYHNQTRRDYANNPFVPGLRWNLSGSHPKEDICDRLAKEHSKGMGRGIYRAGEVPDKPHPQCFCNISPEVLDDDAFDQGFFSGQFNDYLLSKFPDLNPGGLPPY